MFCRTWLRNQRLGIEAHPYAELEEIDAQKLLTHAGQARGGQSLLSLPWRRRARTVGLRNFVCRGRSPGSPQASLPCARAPGATEALATAAAAEAAPRGHQLRPFFGCSGALPTSPQRRGRSPVRRVREVSLGRSLHAPWAPSRSSSREVEVGAVAAAAGSDAASAHSVARAAEAVASQELLMRDLERLRMRLEDRCTEFALVAIPASPAAPHPSELPTPQRLNIAATLRKHRSSSQPPLLVSAAEFMGWPHWTPDVVCGFAGMDSVSWLGTPTTWPSPSFTHQPRSSSCSCSSWPSSSDLPDSARMTEAKRLLADMMSPGGGQGPLRRRSATGLSSSRGHSNDIQFLSRLGAGLRLSSAPSRKAAATASSPSSSHMHLHASGGRARSFVGIARGRRQQSAASQSLQGQPRRMLQPINGCMSRPSSHVLASPEPLRRNRHMAGPSRGQVGELLGSVDPTAARSFEVPGPDLLNAEAAEADLCGALQESTEEDPANSGQHQARKELDDDFCLLLQDALAECQERQGGETSCGQCADALNIDPAAPGSSKLKQHDGDDFCKLLGAVPATRHVTQELNWEKQQVDDEFCRLLGGGLTEHQPQPEKEHERKSRPIDADVCQLLEQALADATDSSVALVEASATADALPERRAASRPQSPPPPSMLPAPLRARPTVRPRVFEEAMADRRRHIESLRAGGVPF